MGQQFLDFEGTKILANKIKEKASYMPDYRLLNNTDKQTITKLITITPTGTYSNGIYKFQLASRIETIGDFEVYVSSGDDKYINVSIQYEGNSDIANRLRGYLFKNTSTQTTTFELYYIGNAWDETKVYNKTLNPRVFNLVYNMTNVSALPTNATKTITPVAKAWKGNSASATKLQTARTINGVSFDGTANIVTPNITTGGNITLFADSDSSTTTEYASIKAGGNELKITSSGGGSSPAKNNNNLTFNGNVVYHTGKKPTPSEIGASPTSHNHDDRYYTESEINNTLTTYQKAYTDLSQLGLTTSNTIADIITALPNKSTFTFNFGDSNNNTILGNQMPDKWGTLCIVKVDASRTIIEFNTSNNNQNTTVITSKYYCNYNEIRKEISEWVMYGMSNNISNPNLLINGDFRINQRGKAEYRDTGYTVDRWYMSFSEKTIPKNNGVQLVSTSDIMTNRLEQRIEDYYALRNKTLTLSVKLTDLNMSSNKFSIYVQYANDWINLNNTNKNGVLSGTFTMPSNPNKLIVMFQAGGIGSYTVEWAKLEVGTVATPFVAKTKADELRDCSRYYAVVPISQGVIACDGNTQVLTFLNYPVPMRVQPTATANNPIYFQKINGGTPILLRNTGESVLLEAWKDYSTTCMCWLVNGSTPISGLSDGLMGTLNGSNTSTNRLSGSGWIVLDAEIY